MPISKYFGGHGEEVAKAMQKEYGENWKHVFYGKANKLKKKSKRRTKTKDLMMEAIKK